MLVREVFIGNLHFGVTEDELSDFLVEHGHVVVQEVKIHTDRQTGRSRGYGFARLGIHGSPGDFSNVLERLSGQKLRGRAIGVSLSSRERERQARQGSAAEV